MTQPGNAIHAALCLRIMYMRAKRGGGLLSGCGWGEWLRLEMNVLCHRVSRRLRNNEMKAGNSRGWSVIRYERWKLRRRGWWLMYNRGYSQVWIYSAFRLCFSVYLHTRLPVCSVGASFHYVQCLFVCRPCPTTSPTANIHLPLLLLLNHETHQSSCALVQVNATPSLPTTAKLCSQREHTTSCWG